MRSLFCAALAVLALQPAMTRDARAAPVRWSGNGHLYEVRHVPEGLSWPQALLRAEALGCGWHLATPTSAAENAFVFGLARKRPEVFTGGGILGPWLGGFQKNARDEPAGGWRWVTEEAFTYVNWNRGEPNDIRNDEAFLNFWDDGAWNDVDAFGTIGELPKGFIVEFDTARQSRCRKLG